MKRTLPVILSWLPMLALLIGYLVTGSLRADVTMSPLFGDHMVVQQERTLPIWGRADAGEKITVKLGPRSAETIAAEDGTWRVNLEPLPPGAAPLTLQVTGKNSLIFQDVLVGDVWVCSGQSNMEFPLQRAHNAETELPQADDPRLRLFLVAHRTAHFPVTEVKGEWVVCTPQTAANFSAVAYFFARHLQEKLDRPFGLIGSYWGGKPAETFTSLHGLKQSPGLQHYVDAWNQLDATYDSKAEEAYVEQLQPAYQEKLKAWNAGPDGQAWAAAQAQWKLAKAAAVAGQPQPPRPQAPATLPLAPLDPTGGDHFPAALYDGMIAPLQPYAIKGVIWYQGEANASRAAEYRELFPALITDWRRTWGQGDFPFLFVQLSSFRGGSGEEWPALREAQLKTLALPNTGMAVTVDIGLPDNIHPMDKLDVGLRLAAAAWHLAYGGKEVYSGPIYQTMEKEGSRIRLHFTQTGSGLKIGSSPWVGPHAVAAPTDHLSGFTVAGADQQWFPAQATISSSEVVVSSTQVSAPVAVRYEWAAVPDGNLSNAENFPASPFRTDEWPLPQPAIKK